MSAETPAAYDDVPGQLDLLAGPGREPQERNEPHNARATSTPAPNERPAARAASSRPVRQLTELPGETFEEIFGG